MYDVIVIGGGPVGSYVAYKLAGVNHKVVVLEKREKPWEQVCCTGIIGQECVSAFAVDAAVIFRQANSAGLFSPSGKLFRLQREKPQAYIVDRAAFDRDMARRAQDKGTEYVFNCLASNLEVKDDRVKVEVIRHGKVLSFEARVAVIAAGFGSKLVERLGMDKIGDFVMGTQVEVKGIEVDEIEVYFGQKIAPGFFGWLVPTAPQLALVGLLSRRSPGLYLKKLVSSLVAQGRIALTEAKPSYGGIPLKPLARTYGERLIVVGDAAGQVKPTTGGGIYYGLLCADIAAGTLHQALERDNLSARSLARYEREWRKKLGWELKVGYWARKFYERLSDEKIDRIFDIIKSKGIDKAILEAEDLSFDWHGKVMLRLLGYRALTEVIGIMRVPFRLGGRG